MFFFNSLVSGNKDYGVEILLYSLLIVDNWCVFGGGDYNNV